MLQEYINIYQKTRTAAGITQERASEVIGISVESIRAYESGNRIPPDNVVLRMIEVYNAQFLAVQHLREKSKIARDLIPDIEPQDIPSAILKVYKEVNDFMKRRDELIEIGSDGIITEDERVVWDEIMKELDDVFKAIMAIKFCK